MQTYCTFAAASFIFNLSLCIRHSCTLPQTAAVYNENERKHILQMKHDLKENVLLLLDAMSKVKTTVERHKRGFEGVQFSVLLSLFFLQAVSRFDIPCSFSSPVFPFSLLSPSFYLCFSSSCNLFIFIFRPPLHPLCHPVSLRLLLALRFLPPCVHPSLLTVDYRGLQPSRC